MTTVQQDLLDVTLELRAFVMQHLAGKHDQNTHGRRGPGAGDKVNSDKMATAVNDYLNTSVKGSDVTILATKDFDKRFGTPDENVHGGIAAIRTDDGKIFIKEGFESDGVHELVHQAGALETGVNTFLNEGVTQAATKRIAEKNSLKVRDTYTKETDTVETYILPTVGISEQNFFKGYVKARDKGQYVSDLIWEKHGNKFSNVEDWGKNPRQSLTKGIKEILGYNPHLDYLVNELGVGK